MEQGLAATMTYGDGSDQTVKHYYDKGKKTKKKEPDMGCKSPKKKQLDREHQVLSNVIIQQEQV